MERLRGIKHLQRVLAKEALVLGQRRVGLISSLENAMSNDTPQNRPDGLPCETGGLICSAEQAGVKSVSVEEIGSNKS